MQQTGPQTRAARRIAVLGGTFNPVHCGHVQMAQGALMQANVDEVWLMPSRLPPHKVVDDLASEAHRYEMVKRACAGHEGLVASDVEMRRTGTTYTVDTLRALKELVGEVLFLIGSDTILQLETWRDPASVFTLCEFLAFPRVGVDEQEVAACMKDLKERYGARITLSDRWCQEVSSTEVRQRIKGGESLEGLVPTAVEDYIRTHRLYEGQR